MSPSGSFEWLAELVAWPSLSGRPNRQRVEWLGDYLGGLGADLRVIPGEADRLNLLASFGSGDGGPLIGGHLDVVPAEPAHWQSDPFTLTPRGERLYGRGTSDMKGFVANMLAIAPTLAHAPRDRPVHLLFTTDEELGCIGMRHVAASLARSGPRPDWVLIGEPTGLDIATAHKGKVAFEVSVAGQAGHSSDPRSGCSAIDAAARLISRLGDLAEDLRREPAAPGDWGYPWTSIHVGTVEGGEALNVIPARCRFDCEIRYLPGADIDNVISQMYGQAAALQRSGGQADDAVDIDWQALRRYPPARVDPTSAALRWLRDCLPDAVEMQADYGAEAGVLQSALGVDALLCGPGCISRAHRPDEFITRGELTAGEAALRRILQAPETT
jgi:acetylornithine deacetylase